MNEEESVDVWQGCHGEVISSSELDMFLTDAFMMDDLHAQNPDLPRFATLIEGHTGIGKTSKIKSYANRPVEWMGEKFDGYDVKSVPIAQFQEMGDLHGLPDKHVRVRKEDHELWVSIEVRDNYLSHGWEVVHEAGVQMMYAAPDWVPRTPKPTILLLDDYNRAGSGIIKGIMQLLQEYQLMSWKLPPGSHIVLTANPDEQDYFVTSVDRAVLQRFRICTLKFEATEWAIWAEAKGVDPRIISFVLKHHEMITQGTIRTSPRSIAEFGIYLSQIGKFSIDEGSDAYRRVSIMGKSYLDTSTVGQFLLFMERDYDMVITPEQILDGKDCIRDNLRDLMDRETGEKRVDILGIIFDRLFAFLCKPEIKPEGEALINVQEFLLNEWIPAEYRYVFIDRLERMSKELSYIDKWYLGNSELTKDLLEIIK